MKIFFTFLIVVVFASTDIQAQVKDSIIENIYDEYYVVKRNDRFLLLDSLKTILQDCDSIYRPLVDNREYVIAKKDKWGVVGFNGKVRIPFEYDFIRPMYYSLVGGENAHKEDDSSDIFLAQKGSYIGKINFKNEIVLPIEYDGITDWVEYGPDGHYVSRNGKIGIITHNNEIVIPTIYDSIYVEHWDDIIKAKLDGKFGVINSRHKVLIPFKYDGLLVDTYRKETKKKFFFKTYLKYYVVKLDGEWMYLSKKGKISKRGISQKEIEEKYISPHSINPYWMLNNYDFEYIGRCMIKPKNIK